MNEETNNEEVVLNDVPETSEENLEEVNISTSEDEEQIQETVEKTETNAEDDINKLVEERANKMFEEKVKDRLARDRASQERKFNKELAKYKHLESVINAGLGVDNLDDAISKTSSFYQEQGITIPEFKDSYSERDEKILAKADAKEIIDLGRDEMEAEANRIASIPETQRTIREKVVFDTICEELTNIKATEELKSKGYDVSILDNKDFQDFRNQFTVSTPISKIYDMYNKVNGTVAERPKSPGSAKSTTQVKQIKDYYSPEDFDKLTVEDLNNPEVMKVVDKSRLQWYKER
jgi:hypothetical protein